MIYKFINMYIYTRIWAFEPLLEYIQCYIDACLVSQCLHTAWPLYKYIHTLITITTYIDMSKHQWWHKREHQNKQAMHVSVGNLLEPLKLQENMKRLIARLYEETNCSSSCARTDGIVAVVSTWSRVIIHFDVHSSEMFHHHVHCPVCYL